MGTLRRPRRDDFKAGLEAVALRALRAARPAGTVALLEYPARTASRWGWGRPAHPDLLRTLQQREPESAELAASVTALSDDLRAIPGGRSEASLAWDNDWWGGLDAMVLYTVLRDRRPAQYLEVGSGYSTRFARRAVEDHGLQTRITSIDPSPRASIDALCDEVIRRPLAEAEPSVFDRLGAGDVLVVDGSHTAFMGSDTVVALLEVMPRLPPGVLVGIDDVFLPWDYPPQWADRWYGEQYLLATWLLAGAAGWKLRFPAWHLTQESSRREQFSDNWEHIRPLHGRYAMSFWVESSEGSDGFRHSR